MQVYRTGFRLLTHSLKPILLFELLLKTVSLLVLAPMLGGLVQAAIAAAHLRYLTNSNLLQFLRSPGTLLLLLIILMVAALYTLFELSAVITCFSNTRHGKRTTVYDMLRAGGRAVGALFRRGNPFMLLHLLMLLPVMQFSVTSGSFTMIGVPDLFSYYLTRKIYLVPLYLLVTALCAVLVVRHFFAVTIFTLQGVRFRTACRRSRFLTRKSVIRTLCSVLLWNLFYLAALTLLLCLIAAGVLLLRRGAAIDILLQIGTFRFLRMLVQAILLLFSCCSVPIAASHMTALYYRQTERMGMPGIEDPPLRRQPIFLRNKRTVQTTMICLSLCAAVLHVSYLYSLVTGQSTLQLSLLYHPQITAHRGLSSAAPENTMAAFEEAVAIGADYIELDVQQTKDGVLVVLHDTNLKRTAGVNRFVWDMTYAELQELDVGSWFSPRYAETRIPTLEDVLAMAQDTVQLNIEIKPVIHSETLEQSVVELIETYDFVDRCCITSFSYSSLQKVKACNPAIRTGYIMSMAYGQFYKLSDADVFSVNKLFVTRQMVLDAHRNGKEIFAWTVNSASEIQSLQRMQVDNIITDRPQLAQTVIAQDIPGKTLLSVLDYLLH